MSFNSLKLIFASLCIPAVLVSAQSAMAEEAPIYCESGDPSGRGPQAYIELTQNESQQMAKITWISARGKRSEYTLPLVSVISKENADLGKSKISIYKVSNSVRFQFTEFANFPKTPSLSLISFGRTTTISCQL
ncbi:MAG TPA: hypothetical protein VN132_13670 [Bdellovibrio sp.]|nr:hypothetical protein [Bdellovibrio sp.]